MMIEHLHNVALHGEVPHVVACVELEEAGHVPEEREQDHGQDVDQAREARKPEGKRVCFSTQDVKMKRFPEVLLELQKGVWHTRELFL